MDRFNPMSAALLILDMQLYFLDASSHAFIPSAEATLPGLLELVEAFNDLGSPVFLTRHLNSPENAGMLELWWRDLIREDNPLSRIIPELAGKKANIIVKSQYDAFHETPLKAALLNMGVTQLVICGVMTHLCCETTARSAFVNGFEVFFPVDGNSTYNEKFHRAALAALAHGFAHLVTVDDIIRRMRIRND